MWQRARQGGSVKPALLAVLLVFALPYQLTAATVHVPADRPTIQAAIDAAASGDTVLVAPGTYGEAINFNGKIITVTSEQGPAVTVIDAGGQPTVVTFTSGETRNAILSGFTITGGRNTYSGAGISVSFSSPTIRENIITGNSGCSGVGIDSYFSSPRIEHNTISRNVVDGCTGGWGIGIYVGGNSTAEIIGNVIVDNRGEAASGGGIALFAAGNAVVVGNVIARNATAGAAGCGWGGGMAIANFVQATIVNNLIVGNSACYGGALHWRGSSGNTMLVNNTIADNAAASWPGIYATGVDARNQIYNNIISARFGPALYCDNGATVTPPVLDSNDVFSMQTAAYGGTCADQTGLRGNLSADPQFLDPDAGKYRVGFGSPVVDAGNNWAPDIQMTDLAGNPRIAGTNGGPDRIDIGAYEYSNRAPLVDAGADQTVSLTGGCVASVTLNGIAFDEDGDALNYTWTSAVGTFSGPSPTVSLPAGSYTFTLTVTDGNGGSAADSVSVIVRDITAPTIGSVTATPSVLTSANHEMVPVVVGTSTSDACGGAVTCRIVAVTSNEPTSGLGGGDVGPNDWQITGALTVNLRAERWHKGSGRAYTITVECTDAAGNRATSMVTVTVPRK
jgi:serine protease